MKILFTGVYSHLYGGLERFAERAAAALRDAGVPVAVDVAKLGEGDGPHAVELIEAGEVQLVGNSPRGRGPRADGDYIRSAACIKNCGRNCLRDCPDTFRIENKR